MLWSITMYKMRNRLSLNLRGPSLGGQMSLSKLEVEILRIENADESFWHLLVVGGMEEASAEGHNLDATLTPKVDHAKSTVKMHDMIPVGRGSNSSSNLSLDLTEDTHTSSLTSQIILPLTVEPKDIPPILHIVNLMVSSSTGIQMIRCTNNRNTFILAGHQHLRHRMKLSPTEDIQVDPKVCRTLEAQTLLEAHI